MGNYRKLTKHFKIGNYDFTLGDSFMVGDVEFIWKEFYCPTCKKRIPTDEMRRIEKSKRKDK